MITYNKDDKVLSKIAEIVSNRLKVDIDLALIIDESMGEYTGTIEDGIVLTAGSCHQMLDLCGRVLRNKSIRGEFTSYKKMSGMYFATHFNNYLDAAPLEELYVYIEDLALWGMNTLKLWFDMHHYNNMEEAKTVADRQIAILKYAKSIGVKTALTALANESFANSPRHLRADWTAGHDGYINELNSHYHVEICPNVDGGIEEIVRQRREVLEYFRDVDADYIAIGPYDQGGCSCSKCAPWGGNGYLKAYEAIAPVIKEIMPNAKIVLSLWQFGTFTGDTREFELVQKALGEGRFPEIEFLESEPQYADYAVTHDMHRPVINFTEISMYGACPWGGFGANPLPKLFREVWEKSEKALSGGWPYSEGIYEDINKVIMLRYYRDNQKAEDTVREYLAYEFGLDGEMLEKAFKAICGMEDTLERKFRPPFKRGENDVYYDYVPEGQDPHRYIIQNPEKIFDIEKAILEVHASLPEKIQQSQKWQLIYLRAVIDGELLRNDFWRNEKVLDYFNELIERFHLQNAGWATYPDAITDDANAAAEFNRRNKLR